MGGYSAARELRCRKGLADNHFFSVVFFFFGLFITRVRPMEIMFFSVVFPLALFIHEVASRVFYMRM